MHFRNSCVVALATLLLSSASATSWAQTTQIQGKVNINQATAEQLELLPGVGPARAAAIIEYRKRNGPFKRTDQLVEVSGIGQKALERIEPHCSVQGKTTLRH